MSEPSTVCNKCVTCGKEFASDELICPDDGGILVAAKQDPAVGTIIADKYEVQEVLGGGGMGVVYKAKHLLMHRTVAIKMLLPETVSNEYALARFQKEAQAASALNHPNILTIFDFGISDKRQPYLVMDYLKGETLADILEAEKYLHLQRAQSIFIQIASALAHAHQKGVIHRDLKPANIMLVEYEGQGDFVKIVDFGIAKTVHTEGGHTVELTQTGQVFGSPLYMSPEQCRGTHMDARSDIYSIGCVMYRCVTGGSPFHGQDALELMFKHVNQAPPKFCDFCPDIKIPENFENVVRKCMEKEPDNRYQTMLELRRDLETVASSSMNSPFIFPAGEADATKTPRIGSLDEERSTLNTIIAMTESQKQKAAEVAAAQEKVMREKNLQKEASKNSESAVGTTGQLSSTGAAPGNETAPGNGTTPHNGTAITQQPADGAPKTADPLSAQGSKGVWGKLQDQKILVVGGTAALFLLPLAAMLFKPSTEDKKASGTASTVSGDRGASSNSGTTSGGSGTAPDNGSQTAADELKAGSEDYSHGNYVQAKDSLERAYSRAVLEKNLPVKYDSGVLLGQIDLAQGNYDGAKACFYAVVNSSEHAQPDAKPSDKQTATALNALGVIATNQGNYARAHESFKAALALRQKMPPKDADVEETLMGMGTLALYEQKYKDALDYFTTAKKTSEAVNGPDHVETANILNNMGQAYQFLGKYPEADACYKQALAIRKKSLSPSDPAIASTEMCMAALAFKKRDYQTSENLFQDALSIDSKALGTDNLLVAQIYFSLGVLYQQQKKFDKAAEFYQKALDVQQRKLDANSSKLKHTKALLDQVKSKKRR